MTFCGYLRKTRQKIANEFDSSCQAVAASEMKSQSGERMDFPFGGESL